MPCNVVSARCRFHAGDDVFVGLEYPSYCFVPLKRTCIRYVDRATHADTHIILHADLKHDLLDFVFTATVFMQPHDQWIGVILFIMERGDDVAVALGYIDGVDELVRERLGLIVGTLMKNARS